MPAALHSTDLAGRLRSRIPSGASRWLPAHVPRFAPEDVTRVRDGAEADPAALGLQPGTLEAIWQAVVRAYQSGLHPAIAVCLRYRGQVVLDRSIGHARGNAPDSPPTAEKVPASPDTPFLLFSASKALTAMVVHLLDQERSVHLDDPVVEYIPEFGRHGKHRITLRHLLTHRAGIPQLRGNSQELDQLLDPQTIVAQLCDTRPAYPPGRRLAYHALSGGFLLGEVVRRVTGRDIRSVLRERILDPVGIQGLGYGVPSEHTGRVAECAFSGVPLLPPYSWVLERALGAGIHDVVRFSNDSRFLTSIIPAGNVIGTADEACRFMELMRQGGELGGVRVFDRRTVRRAIAEQTYYELDLTLGVPIRYGMGFVLGGRWWSPYGLRTPRAFGHLGFTVVQIWADPDRELSAAILTSGKPILTPGQVYFFGLIHAISQQIPRTRR